MTHIADTDAHCAPARAQLMASMLFCSTYPRQYLEKAFEHLHIGMPSGTPCALLRFEQAVGLNDDVPIREEQSEAVLFVPIMRWDERVYVVALSTCAQSSDALASQVQHYADAHTADSSLDLHFMRVCQSTYELSGVFAEDEAMLAAQKVIDVHPAIAMVMARIRERYATDLVLRDLSAYCRLTEPYLCKLFKQTTGMTLTQYIKMIRVENAKKLLALRKYNVHQVSQMVGYKSEAYFFRIFKECTGCTPHAYATIHEIE